MFAPLGDRFMGEPVIFFFATRRDYF